MNEQGTAYNNGCLFVFEINCRHTLFIVICDKVCMQWLYNTV